MDRREGKKEARRNGRCVTEILLAIEIILFLFVCELFIINFFLLFNLCGFFLLFFVFLFVFLLYFTLFFFVNFGGTEFALSFALLFIVICLFYLFIYLFLPSWIFWGFFCKFNCSWHFFTSSDRIHPGGLHGAPVSGTGIEG